MIKIIFYIALFYLCILISSGLICILYRIKNKIPFNKNCFCENCKTELKFWMGNLPIFNYIILKGKCKYCNSKINILHPILEILIGFNIFYLYLIIFGGI